MADSPRFRKIDESNIGDHARLTAADDCYFLYEYTSGRDYRFSSTNSLISNLKKKPSTRHRPGYNHKGRAIITATLALRGAIGAEWLESGTLVPVPPSKIQGHPDYDDRMSKICNAIAPNKADVRHLVIQRKSLKASHECDEGERPTVESLIAEYSIDETVANPTPRAIAIVDDVLTAGTHYRAMHHVLTARFPGVPMLGVFIARRVFPNVAAQDDFSGWDWDE